MRRPTSAAIHSRAWLTAEKSIAGRAPSATLRASCVTLRATIGWPWPVWPITTSFARPRYCAASAVISSLMPPGSEYERKTS